MSTTAMEEIISFVALLTYDADPEPMTVEDASYNIQQWILEGVEIPEGLTPEILSETFNDFMGVTA